jgi:hypothetical protein
MVFILAAGYFEGLAISFFCLSSLIALYHVFQDSLILISQTLVSCLESPVPSVVLSCPSLSGPGQESHYLQC